jgi:hypothetical protein
VADTLGLNVRFFIDSEDPTNKKRSAHPTTVTMRSDIDMDIQTHRVHLVDGGCLLHKSINGVLFECHANEGFWLWSGPPDHASYNAFGTLFNYQKDMACFPTSTFKFHDKFPARGTVVQTQYGTENTKDTIYDHTNTTQIETLFPDENFMRVCEKLGFNRNRDIVRLMPVIKYVAGKSF